MKKPLDRRFVLKAGAAFAATATQASAMARPDVKAIAVIDDVGLFVDNLGKQFT